LTPAHGGCGRGLNAVGPARSVVTAAALLVVSGSRVELVAVAVLANVPPRGGKIAATT
jgi:hypothetical protein